VQPSIPLGDTGAGDEPSRTCARRCEGAFSMSLDSAHHTIVWA
jgi:hypothetical protein